MALGFDYHSFLWRQMQWIGDRDLSCLCTQNFIQKSVGLGESCTVQRHRSYASRFTSEPVPTPHVIPKLSYTEPLWVIWEHILLWLLRVSMSWESWGDWTKNRDSSGAGTRSNGRRQGFVLSCVGIPTQAGSPDTREGTAVCELVHPGLKIWRGGSQQRSISFPPLTIKESHGDQLHDNPERWIKSHH